MGYRYIGSKARIANDIIQYLGVPQTEDGYFIDAFSGTGIVASKAADAGWKIKINDMMHNAAVISEARFLSPPSGDMRLYWKLFVRQSKKDSYGRNILQRLFSRWGSSENTLRKTMQEGLTVQLKKYIYIEIMARSAGRSFLCLSPRSLAQLTTSQILLEHTVAFSQNGQCSP